MATPTPAMPTKRSATPPRSVNSLLRQCLVHGAALAAAAGASAIAWWAVGHFPDVWLIGALLFARTAAALAFRLDRLRWSEWGERDVRFFVVAVLWGTGLAAALAPNLLTQAVLRVLFVEALVYGVGGLALADALRARRHKTVAGTRPEQRPCLVYGSRGVSRLLAQQLLRDSAELQPFAYLDEDPQLEETVVDGLPVLGCLEDLVRLAAVHQNRGCRGRSAERGPYPSRRGSGRPDSLRKSGRVIFAPIRYNSTRTWHAQSSSHFCSLSASPPKRSRRLLPTSSCKPTSSTRASADAWRWTWLCPERARAHSLPWFVFMAAVSAPATGRASCRSPTSSPRRVT